MSSFSAFHSSSRLVRQLAGRIRILGVMIVSAALMATMSSRAWATVVPRAVPTLGLVAPPKPPTKPNLPTGYQTPTALGSKVSAGPAQLSPSVVAAPSQAVTWGQRSGGPSATTLVLYDTTGPYGWLGELNALGAGHLATHFGTVTAEPVSAYVSGQVNSYTATIYVGTTYNEPLPTAFINDVITTTKPVIWAGDNVWQLSGAEGSAADSAFEAKYGWDPSNSYFDTSDNPVSVTYKGQTFSRDPLNGADILAPNITTPSAVKVLGQANCTSSTGAATTCAPIAQSSGTSFPWAVQSSNLTYVGEDPFSYMTETDRYVAFSDLLFGALAPSAPASHLALVRLEDVSPGSDPTAIRQFADYLSSQGVPFSINVIPEYTDPKGAYNNGTPTTITLPQAPAVVAALQYAQSKGGTLNQEGYTHQYSNVDNPYTGVSGDDAEFYRAQCSSTQNPPYNFQDPCPNSDWVIWTGPLPNDSSSWAAGRVHAGQSLFKQAGLSTPSVWVTPHYFASVADYTAIDSVFNTRWERDVFFGGQLTGGTPDTSHVFGQFFPYSVQDIYGARIIPENLGDYEATAQNNHPARLPADIIHNAQVNLAVTQGVASFFFNPEDPLTDLQQIVSGIKGLGYTFVSASSLP